MFKVNPTAMTMVIGLVNCILVSLGSIVKRYIDVVPLFDTT